MRIIEQKHLVSLEKGAWYYAVSVFLPFPSTGRYICDIFSPYPDLLHVIHIVYKNCCQDIRETVYANTRTFKSSSPLLSA